MYKMAKRCAAEHRTNDLSTDPAKSRFCSLINFSRSTEIGEGEPEKSTPQHAELEATFQEPRILPSSGDSKATDITLELTVSDIKGPETANVDHLLVRYRIPLHCDSMKGVVLPGTAPIHSDPTRCMFLNFREATFIGVFKEKNSPNEFTVNSKFQSFFQEYARALPNTGIDTLVFFPLLCPKDSMHAPAGNLPSLDAVNVYFASTWAMHVIQSRYSGENAGADQEKKKSPLELFEDDEDDYGVISSLEFSVPEILSIRAEEVDLRFPIKKVVSKEDQDGGRKNINCKNWTIVYTAAVSSTKAQDNTVTSVEFDFSKAFKFRDNLSSSGGKGQATKLSFQDAVKIVQNVYVQRLKAADLKTLFLDESREVEQDKEADSSENVEKRLQAGVHQMIVISQEFIDQNLAALYEREASVLKTWKSDDDQFEAKFAAPELQLLGSGKAILRVRPKSVSFGVSTDENVLQPYTDGRESVAALSQRGLTPITFKGLSLAFEVTLTLLHGPGTNGFANAETKSPYAYTCIRVNLDADAQFRPSGTRLDTDGDSTAVARFRGCILRLMHRLTQGEGYFWKISRDPETTDLVRTPILAAQSSVAPPSTLGVRDKPSTIGGLLTGNGAAQLSRADTPLWLTAKETPTMVRTTAHTLLPLIGCNSDSSPWLHHGFFALGRQLEPLQKLVIKSLMPLNARTTLIPDMNNTLRPSLADLRLRTWDDVNKEQLQRDPELTSPPTEWDFERLSDATRNAMGSLGWKRVFKRTFEVESSELEVKAICKILASEIHTFGHYWFTDLWRCEGTTHNRLSVEDINRTANLRVKIEGQVILKSGRVDDRTGQIAHLHYTESTMTWDLTFTVDAVRSIIQGKLWRSGDYQSTTPKFGELDDMDNSSRQALEKILRTSWDINVESLFCNTDPARFDISSEYRLGGSTFNGRGDMFVELCSRAA
ncbi:hypothetical protein C8Q79DRAFT_991104 [Trametes meyenii]|nr:hypothetical protein C8Q79DRAFT_991104 [Trametes meyenii]